MIWLTWTRGHFYNIMFFNQIRVTCGPETVRKVKLWCNINQKLRGSILQKRFLIECRRNDVLPKKIFFLDNKFREFFFHSNFCNRKFENTLNKFKFSLLNLFIKDVSNHVNFLKSKISKIGSELEVCLQRDEIVNLLKHQVLLNQRFLSNDVKHENKLSILIHQQTNVQEQNLNLHRIFEEGDKDPWFVNLTDIQIPNLVTDILRLGQGFSNRVIKSKSKQMMEIVKDVESNIHKIPILDQQDFRNKVLHLLKSFVDKKCFHISNIDQKISKGFMLTKDFLRKNPDIVCMNADKGSVTVCMKKSDYVRDMENLLSNHENFELIHEEPLKQLKRNTFKMLDNWRKKGLLGKDIRWTDINTEDTVLARCYGLRKIHKDGCPLRIVISTINTPTKFLEQNFNLILRDSISISEQSVKNSWEFKKIIIQKTVPDDYVMISLDVVAMFPNISLALVKKAILNRWDKIKTRTRLCQKDFIEGIEFIMNSTYFKFNGSFYRQKFGTPIGSVISPILAEMVMEDLEIFVFEKLDFVLPFYFRYVDDTLLCVPLSKLQMVIDTFNSFHPKLQFTHEIEQDKKINFLDIEVIRGRDGSIITNWYRKSTYSGRILNFFSAHPFQNKTAVIKNLVDRALGLSHVSFHERNLNIVRNILFLNHYPQKLIEKHIVIRIKQIKNKQINNLATNNQRELKEYSSFNTFVLPFFGQISKTIELMLKKFNIHTIFRIPFKMDSIVNLCKDPLDSFERGGVVYKITCRICGKNYVGQTGRLLNTRIEEHKSDVRLGRCYKSVLARHTKEFIDVEHEFDWDNVTILHSESNERKREFMEMLFIKKQKNLSINLKTDLDKLNKSYVGMINYI